MATKATSDYRKLTDFISQLYGKEHCNWKVIAKQISRYVEEDGMTYDQIAKCLYWFYVIEGNSTEKANGNIAIVPYAVAGTREYYQKLVAAQKFNEQVKIDNTAPAREITIKSPRVKQDIKLFEF